MANTSSGSIRTRILRGTVSAALLPLIAVGIVAVLAMSLLVHTASRQVPKSKAQLFDETIGPRLADTAAHIATQLNSFRDERVSDALDWASSPVVVQAARDGAAEARRRGYPERSIQSIESDFTGDGLRVMGADPTVEAFLQSRRTLSPLFAEVFFTDAYGYNVAATNPTSDFVQSDEDWWNSAWTNGIDVGDIEYDESAATFSMDIAVRIDDPATRLRLGVMKAVLSVDLVQSVADRYGTDASGLAVTIFTGDGQILAETATGHSPARVMHDDVLATDASVSSDGALVGARLAAGEPNGFELTEHAALAYATAGGGDAQTWIVMVEQPTAVALAPLRALEQFNEQLVASRRTLAAMLVVFTAAAILLAVLVARVLASRIVLPIVQLRDEASEAAQHRLPAVVAAAEELQGDQRLPALPELAFRTGDELGDLAESFNLLQETAARLAAEQVRQRRRNVSETFVALGRRNQNLVAKQLEFIDRLERTETSPETLENLFLLDHLATRMRRNAESLLVLAGQPAPRRWDHPVSARDVLEAAAVETEDYNRVHIGGVRDASFSGTHASDITHLVAELMENAANFSPPVTPIDVSGRPDGRGGYVITIVDHGVGMTAEEFASANAKLADTTSFDQAPSAYLGFFVIGHLAARHGIAVMLNASPDGGVTANVTVPQALIAAVPARRAELATPPEDDKLARRNDRKARVAALAAAASASASASVAPAARPVDAPAARAVTEAGQDAPLTPADAPLLGELTPSGFARRTRRTPRADAAVTDAAGSPDADVAAPHGAAVPQPRSADEVRNRMANFGAGLQKARRETAAQHDAGHLPSADPGPPGEA